MSTTGASPSHKEASNKIRNLAKGGGASLKDEVELPLPPNTVVCVYLAGLMCPPSSPLSRGAVITEVTPKFVAALSGLPHTRLPPLPPSPPQAAPSSPPPPLPTSPAHISQPIYMFARNASPITLRHSWEVLGSTRSPRVPVCYVVGERRGRGLPALRFGRFHREK